MGQIALHHNPAVPLIDREAIEQTGTAGLAESLFAAAAGRVCGVPRVRVIALALAIGVAELSNSSAALGPVVAGALRVAGERGSVRT